MDINDTIVDKTNDDELMKVWKQTVNSNEPMNNWIKNVRIIVIICPDDSSNLQILKGSFTLQRFLDLRLHSENPISRACNDIYCFNSMLWFRKSNSGVL